MPKVTIDGTEVTYTISYNVSLNRANPHRLTATCQCGVGFIQMAASPGIEKRAMKFIRESLAQHKRSGRCKLPPELTEERPTE